VTGYEEYFEQSGHGRVRVREDAMEIDFVDHGGRILKSFRVEPRRED